VTNYLVRGIKRSVMMILRGCTTSSPLAPPAGADRRTGRAPCVLLPPRLCRTEIFDEHNTKSPPAGEREPHQPLSLSWRASTSDLSLSLSLFISISARQAQAARENLFSRGRASEEFLAPKPTRAYPCLAGACPDLSSSAELTAGTDRRHARAPSVSAWWWSSAHRC
jgi:hypothetical protein